MGARSSARSVWAFFLIDRVDGEKGKYQLFEKLLDGLLVQLQRSSLTGFSIVPRVIGMGAATCQRIPIELSDSGRYRLSSRSVGCDLGGALRILDSSLRDEYNKDRVEVFVFLHSEPAGDWQAGIRALKAREHINLHFYPLIGETGVQPGTAQELETRGADEVRPLGHFTAESVGQVFSHIVLPTLKEAMKMANTASPPAIPEQTAEPVQPIAIRREEASRSPETSAPQRGGASDPSGQLPSAQPLLETSEMPVVSHNTASTVAGEKEQDKGMGSEPGQAEIGGPLESESPVDGVADVIRPSAEMQVEKGTEEMATDQGLQGVVTPEASDEPAASPGDEITQDAADQVPTEEVPAEISGEPATGLGDQVTQVVADQVPTEEATAETPGERGMDLSDEMVREEITPVAKTEPPPVDKDGVATIWEEKEPDGAPGDPDWVDHTDKDALSVSGGWRLIGASRRGKMHAHKGIFREDAFALGEAEGWHLMVVADGGGSCSLSRVGSQLAADTAVATIKRFVKSVKGAKLSAEEVCRMALRQGLEEAWEALSAEAERRQEPLRELGTTFLSVMHWPGEQSSVLGVAQVGDGLVAAEFADGEIVPLAEPDVGETAGVTYFLTSKPWKEWVDRVNVQTLEKPPRLLAAMCDGVADDFIPFDRHLGQLFRGLRQVIEQEQSEEGLLRLLDYDKRGSFDDRTLALIYRTQVGADQTQARETEAEAEAMGDEEPAGESKKTKLGL